jgi:hypothetical protein
MRGQMRGKPRPKIFGFRQVVIIDIPPSATQFLCEVAHGGKNHCQLDFMVAEVRPPLPRLDQENPVARTVGIRQRGVFECELVAENPDRAHDQNRQPAPACTISGTLEALTGL